MKKGLLLLLALWMVSVVQAATTEKIFANYFDIEVGAKVGDAVWGKVHLERNKDVATKPIPKEYSFAIVEQSDNIFKMETERDLAGRIMGRLVVAKSSPLLKKQGEIALTIALKSGKSIIAQQDIRVMVEKETLWKTLFDRYQHKTVSELRFMAPKNVKRNYVSDENVAKYIADLQANNNRFSDVKCYTTQPEDYASAKEGQVPKLEDGSIEYDWWSVVGRIGALGYAYAASEVYGPSGDVTKHMMLKELLYDTIIEFLKIFPVDGNDRLVGGKPIGPYMGDGFQLLADKKKISHQLATHHWNMTDPMICPSFNLMPDLLKDIEKGNKKAIEVHNGLINYFQISSSITTSRRRIDDPDNRWGEIRDTLSSSGAWADANLGHRSRTLLALPVIWADYNRPLTYVQYWYSDFYNDQPFKDFSLSPGWSPNGIVNDLAHWMTKYKVLSHKYGQSGFHPDGTVSHHIGEGTDAAMVAYGFDWLTSGSVNCYAQFKDTPYAADKSQYQFIADRLLSVYPNLFYKGSMDFVVAGRSFFGDMGKFAIRTYPRAVKNLLEAKSKGMVLDGEKELIANSKAISNGSFERTSTTAYWVNEYLVHRKGGNGETPFFASLKLKSERTVGIEDFSKVRKSWHGASGVMPVRVDGAEYTYKVLAAYDWNMLPGLTEEWRTDPQPEKGGAAAAGSGENKIAGVLSDGVVGMGIYHHLMRESYNAASAHKSYYFVDNMIAAMGNNIKREYKGQGEGIYTCIDQSQFDSDITYSIDGKKAKVVTRGASVDVVESVKRSAWLHIDNKGYIVVAQGAQDMRLVTGEMVNVTDKKAAKAVKGAKDPNYIIALAHGVEPSQESAYLYFVVPNVSAEQMDKVTADYLSSIKYNVASKAAQGLYNESEKTLQAAFFEGGEIKLGNDIVRSDSPAMISMRESGSDVVLAISNPSPSLDKQQLTLYTSKRLAEGEYSYRVGGIYPREGERVTITKEGEMSKIVVELPDERDQAFYNYQAELYNATPIVITIPTK